MIKSRFDDDVNKKPYLAGILRTIGGDDIIEELFAQARLPIEDFYKQLSWEVEAGHIRDSKQRLEPA